MVALFSIFPVFAQLPEYLLQPTPKNRPYEPPQWFSRLAGQPVQYLSDLPLEFPEVQKSIGKPNRAREKKACQIPDEQGNKKWGFCDL